MQEKARLTTDEYDRLVAQEHLSSEVGAVVVLIAPVFIGSK